MRPPDFDRAVTLLRAGRPVAFPTDTVYGVGVPAWDAAAVRRLFRLKLRSTSKAIPVLLADLEQIYEVGRDLSPAILRLAERFWPGALTIVVRRAGRIPDEVTAGGDTVAVRIPAHDLARDLIRAVGSPLATTSANLSGQPSPLTAGEVTAQLGRRISLVLDGGRCPGGVPSTVVDATGPAPTIVRPGPIPLEEILAALD